MSNDQPPDKLRQLVPVARAELIAQDTTQQHQVHFTNQLDVNGESFAPANTNSAEIHTIAEQIIKAQEEIVLLSASAVLMALSIGRKLSEVKDQLDHGEFTSWVNEYLTPGGLKLRTAQRYMRLAERFPEILAKISFHHHNRFGVSMSPDEAMSVAQTMSLRAVTELIGKERFENSEPDANGDDKFFEHALELATQYFGAELMKSAHHASGKQTTRVAHWVPTQCDAATAATNHVDMLWVPISHRHNDWVVKQSLDLLSEFTESRLLLLLNDQGSHSWLAQIDAFPRVVHRVPTASGNNQIWRLVFIGASAEFSGFAAAFHSLGPVFSPFTSTHPYGVPS